MSTSSRAPVYLDNAATTALLPEALEAMTACYLQPGNASSLHGSGRRARRHLEEARETVAAALGARPSEVIFTAGGTLAASFTQETLFRAGKNPFRPGS